MRNPVDDLANCAFEAVDERDRVGLALLSRDLILLASASSRAFSEALIVNRRWVPTPFGEPSY